MKTQAKPRLDNEDDFILGMSKEPLGFSVKTQSCANFSVHLFDEFRDAPYYSKVFEMLLEAGEGGLVDVFISSPGGDLDGLNILLEGIKLTDATVRAIIVGSCHSAASIFALHCHEIIVCDSASMLVHNIRTGFGGKIADLDNFVKFSKKMSDKLIQETYSGFLNDSELQEVIHGKELWLDAEQIRERLEKRTEYLTKPVDIPVEPSVKKTTRKKKAPSES